MIGKSLNERYGKVKTTYHVAITNCNVEHQRCESPICEEGHPIAQYNITGEDGLLPRCQVCAEETILGCHKAGNTLINGTGNDINIRLRTGKTFTLASEQKK